VAVLLVLGGCHKGSGSQGGAQLRVLNAVLDAEPLDVLVDDTVKATAVAVDATSGYSDFNTGSRDIKVRSSTTGTVLVEKTVAFANAQQTLVLYGSRGAVNVLVLSDDVSGTDTPASGKFSVRIFGLSAEAGATDGYLVTGDITSTPATIPGVGFGAASGYAQETAGSFPVTFTTAGTKEILFQSAAQTFTAGSKYTIVVFPALGGKLVNAVLLTAGGSGTFIANGLARLKAINAIADSTALNFKADGTTLLSNVPFTGASSYLTTSAGTHNLQIELSAVPGTAIAATTQAMDPARDYSIVAVNTLTQPTLVALADVNTVPAAGFARVRFVNALAGSSPVDAQVNFASQASGIPASSASSYFNLAPSTTYTLTFASPGGVTVLATLTNVEIDAGGVYTVYLLGSAASPQARLVRDR
jgi:hypothetical protein